MIQYKYNSLNYSTCTNICSFPLFIAIICTLTLNTWLGNLHHIKDTVITSKQFQSDSNWCIPCYQGWETGRLPPIIRTSSANKLTVFSDYSCSKTSFAESASYTWWHSNSKWPSQCCELNSDPSTAFLRLTTSRITNIYQLQPWFDREPECTPAMLWQIARNGDIIPGGSWTAAEWRCLSQHGIIFLW
jgi:hypothetical protein